MVHSVLDVVAQRIADGHEAGSRRAVLHLFARRAAPPRRPAFPPAGCIGKRQRPHGPARRLAQPLHGLPGAAVGQRADAAVLAQDVLALSSTHSGAPLTRATSGRHSGSPWSSVCAPRRSESGRAAGIAAVARCIPCPIRAATGEGALGVIADDASCRFSPPGRGGVDRSVDSDPVERPCPRPGG